MESILIFGGGLNQLTLIESAKQLGYKTIVIDPMEAAPARSIADIFEVVAPKDYELTKEIAIKYNVKGIVTSQMENPLMLMAKLANDMNYIFPSLESIQNARNKFLMKQCFNKNNVPCAKGILIKNNDSITKELCEEIGFPLIIKPIDSFSSRGVYKINSFEEISQYIIETKRFSSNGEYLIEEFMEGPEVSVESVTQSWKTDIVQITDKVITPYPSAVEMAHIQPTELNTDIQNKIKELVKHAINAVGLNNCATHAEIKITKGGVKMVEIGARLGGDYITSHLVPLSTGVNIEAAAIQIAMGKTPELGHKFEKGSVIQYLSLPVGKKVKKINNWSSILEKPEVKLCFLFVKENDIIPTISDSAKRMGFVIIQDENRENATIKAKRCEEYLMNMINYN